MLANQLQLTPGQVVSLKVIEIRKRNKQILKKDRNYYDLYDIHISNGDGKEVWAEYVTRDTEDIVRKTFITGVFQFIRCGILSGKGTPEIEPSEDPSLGLQQRIKPQNASMDHNANNSTVYKDPDFTDKENSYSVIVSGRSITFAMGYAKDILVAEISLRQPGYVATEEDIQRMIRNANTINDAIVERVTF